jgi:hypothetical protein
MHRELILVVGIAEQRYLLGSDIALLEQLEIGEAGCPGATVGPYYRCSHVTFEAEKGREG